METPDGNIAEQIIAPAVGRGQHKRRKITRFICDFCGQSFKDRTRWIRHRISHKGLKFQCSQEGCFKKFSCRNKLILHQKTTGHEGEDIVENEYDTYKTKKLNKPRVSCSYCPKTFISTIMLSKHVTNEHPGEVNDVKDDQKEEAIENQEEGQYTETYKTLYNALSEKEEKGENQDEDTEENRRKMKKDGTGKLYSCDECERTFNHPSSLMYHKESVHNDGRRFVCSKCGKSFTHKQLLQRHQMVHSDSRYGLIIYFYEENVLKICFSCRPFPCPDCGLRFKTKSNLFNHRVVHTGEKKFSCQICGQQFAHKTSLTLHLRWHKGI